MGRSLSEDAARLERAASDLSHLISEFQEAVKSPETKRFVAAVEWLIATKESGDDY